MSPSAHTRGNAHAPAYALAVLNWLEAHQRRVVNGSMALHLEMSKTQQYLLLERMGIKTPKSLIILGKDQLMNLTLPYPFILKPNRGGKGAGVTLIKDAAALQSIIDSAEDSIDGIWIAQEYIRARDGFVTRAEFIDGQFVYAVRIDASGGFDLCPADACAVGDQFCAVGAQSKFEVLQNFSSPLIERYEQFLKQQSIEVAGIEFIENASGDVYTYDVNVNTNYNQKAEGDSPIKAYEVLAKFLKRLSLG
jgi:hypothetical protein